MWIAFRIYYLCDTSQLEKKELVVRGGCELLSEFIIFVIHHNFPEVCPASFIVVNCFQNLLSLWYITTITCSLFIPLVLWIAFRIYYLCDTSQQGRRMVRLCTRCELLSEFIIFVIHHNTEPHKYKPANVVNCFQNLLSLWYITTMVMSVLCQYVLWIAFRIYYLCDTSQQFFILKT